MTKEREHRHGPAGPAVYRRTMERRGQAELEHLRRLVAYLRQPRQRRRTTLGRPLL